MKRKIELDVDFMGGQGALTAEEAKALSKFFAQQRATSTKAVRTTKRKLVKASKEDI